MALPDRVQVRISSEAAGSISMTPVVNQTIPLRDLVETILATSGKNAGRVGEMLTRGAVVQGASRFRWHPLYPTMDEVEAVLRTFPDPDPSRPFNVDRCIGVRIHASHQPIELPRQVASERRLLKRRSFWDELLALATRSLPEYLTYSYRTRSDEYCVRLTPDDRAAIRDAAQLLRYSGLVKQVRESALEAIEYSVRFP